MAEYDIPRSALRGHTPLPVPPPSLSPAPPQTNHVTPTITPTPPHHLTTPTNPLYPAHQAMTYDVPPSNHAPLKELPLELGSALDSLARLQEEATGAISRLLGYVTPNWRRREKLEPRLMDVRLAVVRLKTSLHDLAEFGEGVMGNAGKAPDKGKKPIKTLLKVFKSMRNYLKLFKIFLLIR